MGKIFTVILASISLHAAAQPSPSEPLVFKTWKDQQIVEAQNQVARISNRLVMLRSGKIKPEDVQAEFPSIAEPGPGDDKLTARAEKVDRRDVAVRLERELARSQKNVEFAKDLGLEEYFMGYLIQFQDNPEALHQVAARLSKDEVTELIKVLLKVNQQNLNSGRPERLNGVLGKLEASARNL